VGVITVTNVQLYLAIGVPVLVNTALIGLLLAYMNARFAAVDRRFEMIDRRFETMDRRFEMMDRRFDDMRALWISELRRVEDVIDARLKHIEG
jgi:hypothetical protein